MVLTCCLCPEQNSPLAPVHLKLCVGFSCVSCRKDPQNCSVNSAARGLGLGKPRPLRHSVTVSPVPECVTAGSATTGLPSTSQLVPIQLQIWVRLPLGLLAGLLIPRAAFAPCRRGLHKIEHVQGIALKQEMVVYH